MTAAALNLSRFGSVVTLDVKLQARSRLYTIGVAVAVAFGLMLRFLVPEQHAGRGLVGFYLLALGGTTLMFGASLLFLEKGEQTLQALRVSMITSRDYILSKTLTLTAFALVESAIVFLVAGRGVDATLPLLVLGGAVLGAFYTVLGLALAAPHDAVTRFLLPTGAFFGMTLQLPFLFLVDVGPGWLWYLVPTQGPQLLLLAAFEPLTAGQWVYAVGMSIAMLVGTYAFCLRRFRRYIRLPEGT